MNLVDLLKRNARQFADRDCLHCLQAVQQEKCTVYFGAPISYLAPR